MTHEDPKMTTFIRYCATSNAARYIRRCAHVPRIGAGAVSGVGCTRRITTPNQFCVLGRSPVEKIGLRVLIEPSQKKSGKQFKHLWHAAAPFAGEEWQEATATQLGLQSTSRSCG